jgi:hypothetical protein
MVVVAEFFTYLLPTKLTIVTYFQTIDDDAAATTTMQMIH